MKPIGPLKSAYLSYFSKPAQDRRLYRVIARQRVARILVIGLREALRAERMIAAASRTHALRDIHLAAIDLFEARPGSAAPLPLKHAHQVLAKSGAQIRLLPGDPYNSLARAANILTNTDLILISSAQDPESLERAWFYFPRMLHSKSLVLREVDDGYLKLSHAEIERLASHSATRLRAA